MYIYISNKKCKIILFFKFFISLCGYVLWIIKCRAWNWFKVFSFCVIFCEFSKTAFRFNNELVSCIYLSQRYTDVNKLPIFGIIHYTVKLAKWSMSTICLVHKQVITAVKILFSLTLFNIIPWSDVWLGIGGNVYIPCNR